MSTIGPQLPSDPGELDVMRDFLLERGFTPPWPIERKPKTVKGSSLAAAVAEVMANLAAANSVLANLEEQRAKAEADVAAAEKQLEGLGVDSLYSLSRIEGRKTYAICADPRCSKVDIHTWGDSRPGWTCDDHSVLVAESKPEGAPF